MISVYCKNKIYITQFSKCFLSQGAARPREVIPRNDWKGRFRISVSFGTWKNERFQLFEIEIKMNIGKLFLVNFSFIVSFAAVYIGRKLMSFWTGESRVHELYTAACGLYSCWVALRVALVLFMWIPQGWRVIMNKVIEWGLLVRMMTNRTNLR